MVKLTIHKKKIKHGARKKIYLIHHQIGDEKNVSMCVRRLLTKKEWDEMVAAENNAVRIKDYPFHESPKKIWTNKRGDLVLVEWRIAISDSTLHELFCFVKNVRTR